MIDRMFVSPRVALNGPVGDVRPEPTTIGAKLRHLGRVATSVTGTAIGGAQDGRQAFAVDRQEVPT